MKSNDGTKLRNKNADYKAMSAFLFQPLLLNVVAPLGYYLYLGTCVRFGSNWVQFPLGSTHVLFLTLAVLRVLPRFFLRLDFRFRVNR